MTKFSPEAALISTRREFGEHGGVVPSVERASTFTVLEPDTMPEIFQGKRGPENGGCWLYSRHFNPTVDILARYLAAMEGTEYAACAASGMGAISCTLLQLCHAGDHLISSDTIYGGSHAFIGDSLPQMGVSADFVDITDLKAVESAITPQTKVIFTEVVGNPTLKIADIPALAKLAKKHDLKLIVDNTFSPMIFSPKQLGAYAVVYSLTKFINGASDIIGGAVCGPRDLIYDLMDLHTGRLMLLGPTMDPRAAFDVAQRLPHLAIRMREHSRRAMAIALRLEEIGVPVSYPGLANHPQYDLCNSMMNEEFGYGGMLTIKCSDQTQAQDLMGLLQNKEQFGLIAVSLGYFDTLMSCSSASTSSEISAEEQERMGLAPGLLRLAVGFTGTLEDRLAQIERAVREIGLVK